MTPRRILITGGSGFIGSTLIDAAMTRGAVVANIDIRAPTIIGHAASWRPGDLMDADAMMRIVGEFRPDAIFNLAAVADIALAAAAMAPNTQGLSNVVRAAAAQHDRPVLIHASTQLVVRPGYAPRHPRDYAPYTEYGVSKAESEEILWNEAGALRWTIVRPTTIWGPRHATFGGSIWRYLNRRWYLLPTGIDPIRSYGYVGTVVAQMLAILDTDPAAVDRKVFYVGDEPIRSSIWLDGFSRVMTGHRARRVPGTALRWLAELGEWSGRLGGPAPIDRGRLYRMTTDYPVPMDDTFRTLGYGATDINAGIRQTMAWLRSNQPEEYCR